MLGSLLATGLPGSAAGVPVNRLAEECGRSGTFCCCVLVALGVTPDEAEIAFRAARRCGPETEDQRRFVELATIRLGPGP